MTPSDVVAPPGWTAGVGWGWVWGEDDELGALNALTDESRARALATAVKGKVYDLGVLVDRNSWLSASHPSTEVMTFRTARGMIADGLDPDGVSFNTTMVVTSDHAGTQLDGLCHATFGRDAHWYNGFTTDEFARDFGPERAAAHNIPPIIVSAVLIDVPRMLGLEQLEAGHPIGPEELRSALERQGEDVHPGDAVFVRTGAMRNWGDVGSDHDALRGVDTAGISLAAARWLVEQKGAILIASDTSALEVVPHVDGAGFAPVHRYLLIEQGVHVGELHDLEQLSVDEVYRFCYVALTPKVRGTTAGFAMRPIAMI